jgi:hypothetical protein
LTLGSCVTKILQVPLVFLVRNLLSFPWILRRCTFRSQSTISIPIPLVLSVPALVVLVQFRALWFSSPIH